MDVNIFGPHGDCKRCTCLQLFKTGAIILDVSLISLPFLFFRRIKKN